MVEGQSALIEADMHQPKHRLKKNTMRYFRCTKGLFLCSDFYSTYVIDADT